MRCVVCGHKLASHVDEGDGWRCHALGGDLCQCECWLRKAGTEGEIGYYDEQERIAEARWGEFE